MKPMQSVPVHSPPRLELVRHCRLCGSPDIIFEFVADGCAVCQCAQCRLLFLNPQGANSVPAGSEPAMQTSVYELHAVNAAARLDRLLAYGGTVQRVMIAGDAFLTGESTPRSRWCRRRADADGGSSPAARRVVPMRPFTARSNDLPTRQPPSRT